MSKDNPVSFVIEKGITICNNTVFNLPMSTIEKLTYLAMVRYGGKNKQAWPANETLAECVSCSKRRVVTAVNRLEKHGLVVKTRRNNKTNIYYINPPESFCPVEPVKKAKSKAKEEALLVGTDDSAGCMGSSADYTNNIAGCMVNTQGCTTDTRGCTWFTPGVHDRHQGVHLVHPGGAGGAPEKEQENKS